MLIIIVIINLLTLPQKTPLPVVTVPAPTPSIENTFVKYVQYPATLNQQTDAELKDYEKSDRHRIDSALSSVRLNSPITQPDFTVDYNYSTATYTITLKQPADISKNKALLWLKNIGISESDLDSVRISWTIEP